MEIRRIGSQPSNKGPADWFTGTVRIDPLFQANAPAHAAGASVTFEPGARTAWHTHPLGQTLIVTAGCGRVQREGGPIEEIHPGDVIWFPLGEKHWHGAAPTTAVTHMPFRKRLTVRSLTGWKRSPTTNIAGELSHSKAWKIRTAEDSTRRRNSERRDERLALREKRPCRWPLKKSSHRIGPRRSICPISSTTWIGSTRNRDTRCESTGGGWRVTQYANFEEPDLKSPVFHF